MQNFTKTQVLALFLGAVSAADLTPIQVLNGPTDDATTIKAEKDGQVVGKTMNASSGTACSGNAGCTTANEKCGLFHQKGTNSAQAAVDTKSNICVHEDWCNAAGRINLVPFTVQCWADVAADVTAVEPTAVDATAYLTAIKDWLTKSSEAATWDTTKNMIISPMFNYQDGWYKQIDDSASADNGKWKETDKPVENKCTVTGQCVAKYGDTHCCATYPDQNNRRCIVAADEKKSVTVAFSTFAPACMVPDTAPDGGNVVPENAQDDIAKGALAEAAEALDSFYASQLKDAKDKAKYTDMTDDEKKKWDADWEAKENERKAFFKTLETKIGYDTDACDDTCKELFQADILAWAKATYETCKLTPKDIKCREANKLRSELEDARKGDGGDKKNFYSGMDKEKREAFIKEFAAQAEKNEASLAAAWVKDNAPKAGESGSTCAGETKCSDQNMCCGNSRPVGAESSGNLANQLVALASGSARVEGQIDDVCAKNGAKWEDALGREFNHTCFATRMMATATAAVVAAYSLM